MFALPASAALVGRNLDSNTATYEAFYDDVLDITWLADANLAKTQTFGVSGIASNGKMDWSEAGNWFTAMNAANYLGLNDWRLPTMVDIGDDGCNETNAGTDCGFNVLTYNSGTGEVYSEMAYHYHENFEALSSRRANGTLNAPEDYGILNAPDPSGYLPLFSILSSLSTGLGWNMGQTLQKHGVMVLLTGTKRRLPRRLAFMHGRLQMAMWAA